MSGDEQKLKRLEKQVQLLADRYALVLVELVRRDLDYGPYCYDDWYCGEVADYNRKHRYCKMAKEFIRKMIIRDLKGQVK